MHPDPARPIPLVDGLEIEKLACVWFTREFQAKLIASNHRCKWGEIDLIFEVSAADGALELVFIEVRCRRPGNWQDGIESVDRIKQRKLLRAIRHYLAQYRGKASSVRLDILAWDGTEWDHLENVILRD